MADFTERGGEREIRVVEKHPLAIRWFHWVNFPVMTLMIWSGLLIYWANDAYDFLGFHFFPEKFFSGSVLGFKWDFTSRLAEGMAWHFTLAYLFGINGILYVLFLAFSGEWRYLVPKLRSFKEAALVMARDMFLTKKEPPKRKFNGAQQFAYSSIVLLGLLELLTGIAIYKPIQVHWLADLFGGYDKARMWHFVFMLCFVAFFLIHVMQVIRAGWNNFRSMVAGYEVMKEEEPEYEPA